MEQLDAISDANTAIVKARQYLAENRKTVDKDKKPRYPPFRKQSA